MGPLDFAETAETLNMHARQRGLLPVNFRGRPGARALKRLDDGTGIVSVELVGRSQLEVVWDMILGVLAFNGRSEDENLAAALHVAVHELWRDTPPQPDHRPADGSEPW